MTRRWTSWGIFSSAHSVGWTTLLRMQPTPSKPRSGQGVVVLVVEEAFVVVVVEKTVVVLVEVVLVVVEVVLLVDVAGG